MVSGDGTSGAFGSTTSRPLIIGLLWHSATSDNLGVGALTLSQIAIVRKVAGELGLSVSFMILGWRDPRPSYVTGSDVKVVGLRSRDLIRPKSGLPAHVRRCDLVLDIGAGDSFADIYGNSRFIKVILSKIVVLFSRRPLVLSPQTIGPFKRWWTRPLARATINGATIVCTRDQLSTEYVGQLGYHGDVTEATDVALVLPFEPAERPSAGCLRVGVNVSGLLFNGGYTRDNMFGLCVDYRRLVRELIGSLVSRDDCEVHLVGHVISRDLAVEDDHRVAEALSEAFPGTIVAPSFTSPCEAKSYIATLDFFCGSRMHACIAAFSSGVPVVPLAYSRKFVGLFATLGYDETIDLRSETVEAVVARVQDALGRLDAIRGRLSACMEEGQARLRLYETALAACLRELSEAPR
jgi:polysaccharide pyruvyl transferase WcaK-like protein